MSSECYVNFLEARVYYPFSLKLLKTFKPLIQLLTFLVFDSEFAFFRSDKVNEAISAIC